MPTDAAPLPSQPAFKLLQKRVRTASRRARQEHAGVTIATQKRRGETRVVLRYKDPRTKLTKQCERLREDGSPWPFTINDDRAEFVPITTREQAKILARRLSNWLWSQRAIAKLEAQGVKVQVPQCDAHTVTWARLRNSFETELETKAASRKTILSYGQTWKFVNRWINHGGPPLPESLNREHLRDFIRFLRQHRFTWGEAGSGSKGQPRPLSPFSVASHARHLRAVLNFGRKSIGCITLDGEAVSAGLVVGRLPRLVPIALRPQQLCSILKAAGELDRTRNSLMFPFFAFLMASGARRGEALALRFEPSVSGAAESWLDLARGMVVIWGSKTARQRILPLATRPLLMKILDTLVRRRARGAEYVFAGGPLPAGNAGDMLGTAFKVAIKDVKQMCGVSFRLKDFRSTCATVLANSSVLGGNLYTLAGELGHNIEVLQKHYASHVAIAPELETARTVEAALGIEDEVAAWLHSSGSCAARSP